MTGKLSIFIYEVFVFYFVIWIIYRKDITGANQICLLLYLWYLYNFFEVIYVLLVGGKLRFLYVTERRVSLKRYVLLQGGKTTPSDKLVKRQINSVNTNVRRSISVTFHYFMRMENLTAAKEALGHAVTAYKCSKSVIKKTLESKNVANERTLNKNWNL